MRWERLLIFFLYSGDLLNCHFFLIFRLSTIRSTIFFRIPGTFWTFFNWWSIIPGIIPGNIPACWRITINNLKTKILKEPIAYLVSVDQNTYSFFLFILEARSVHINAVQVLSWFCLTSSVLKLAFFLVTSAFYFRDAPHVSSKCSKI